MKKTVKGVVYDTENAEEISNHDTEDAMASMYLRHTKEGKYFLQTKKCQIRKGGKWIDCPMDGSARGFPRNAFHTVETITPMTQNEAVDWYLVTVMPEPLAKAIQQKHKVETANDNLTITIDALSTKLVRWYADENAREILDVVNGVLAGELGHLREEIEGEHQDDTHLHIVEYVKEAAHRRFFVEASRGPRQGSDSMQTEKAIVHLQDVVAKRFGTKVDTECGAATISISHDQMILTDARGVVVAEGGTDEIVRQLTGRESELLVA